MKTTAFKIFASYVAIVCLASSPVTKAAPALKSVLGTSENPIVQKLGIKDNHLVGLITNEVVQKPAMAVYDPTVSQKLHRQRRTFNSEEEDQLRQELEDETSSASVDSKEADPIIPDLSNERSQKSYEVQNSQSNEVQNSQSNGVQNSQSNGVQDSQPSNEVQNSQQSNEVQNSQQSNEVQNSQSDEVQNSQSDEVKNSQSDEVQNSQSDEDYEESDNVYKFRELPDHFNSNLSLELEGSNDIEHSNESASTNDDKEESDTPKPTQKTTT